MNSFSKSYLLKVSLLFSIPGCYCDVEGDTPPPPADNGEANLQTVRDAFSIDVKDDLTSDGEAKKEETPAPAAQEVVPAEEYKSDEGLDIIKIGEKEYTKEQAIVFLADSKNKQKKYTVGEKEYSKADLLNKISGKPLSTETSEETDTENKDDKTKDELPPQQTFTINNEDFTLEEIEKGTEEYYGVKLADLPQDSKDKMINSYVDALNKKETNKILNEKFRKAADKTKEVEAKEAEILQKEQEFEAQREELKSTNDALTKKITELETILAKDEDEVLDGNEKTKLIVQKENATEKLATAKKLKEQVETELDNIYYDNQIQALQTTFPGLQTKRHIYDIITDYENGKIPDKEELKTARKVQEVMKAYAESNSKVGIVDFAEIEFSDISEASVKKPGEKKEKVDLSGLTFEQRMNAIRKAQKEHPAPPKDVKDDSTNASETTPLLKRPTLAGIGFE